MLFRSMRPVVLPGEIMRVFILKEGKESSQGVAYLDDGTMVVVDNARRMISKTIDIAVTSVLQTTAGKMIFGRLWDERESAAPQTAHVAPATQTTTETSFEIHDSRSLGFRKATRELRQTTIIEELD